GLAARRARLHRWHELSSSWRPARPLNGQRRRGRRGGCRSATATAIERWRLLARVPVLLVGRDHTREDVLVRPAFAGAVGLQPALLDAVPADEGLALEVLVADRPGGARLRGNIVGLEPQRAVENRLQHAAADLNRLGVARGGALHDPVFPDLATLE